MNPYDVLGVDRDADDDEVKEAYREKAKKHHPDQGGDEEKFKEIQAAYDQIKDGGDVNINTGPFGGGPTGFEGGFGETNKSVEDFIRDFEEFARQGGFDRRGFQGDPFGGARQEIIYEVPVEFQKAVCGGKCKFRIGSSPTGSLTGERIEVDVPAGTQDGDTFNHPDGFTIKFKVQDDTEYWRKNKNDIYTTREISVWNAMTGAEVSVHTITGQEVSVSIAPGTQNGEMYRLPDLGGPKTYDGRLRGDMYVEVSVDIPKVTEEERIELIDQLRDSG